MSQFTWKLSTPLKEVLKSKERKLEVVYDGDTLRFALQKMKEANILSLPVVGKDKAFEGMIDTVDIAGFALASWKGLRFKLDPQGAEFLDKPVYDVLGFSEVSKVAGKHRSISEDQTIGDALRMFNAPLARHFTRTHRLAVLDNHGRLVNLLSQSDLIRFAFDNIDLLGNKDVPISELQVFRPPVVVEINTPFYEALTLLYENRIGGLGLVDNEWRLVGCFSASDLRGVGDSLFQFFECSVLTFMCRATDSTLKCPVTIKTNATLHEAIRAMVTNSVHRVFVVDASGRTKAVVAMTDLLEHLERFESNR